MSATLKLNQLKLRDVIKDLALSGLQMTGARFVSIPFVLLVSLPSSSKHSED